MPKFSSLGDRMKFFETNFGSNLTYTMPLCPVILRLDGRAFHSFTRGLERPFHKGMCLLMDATTKELVEETGACIGYTQSDEITLIIHNEDHESQIYFDGKIDKINSLLAAKCSNFFTANLGKYIPEKVGHYPIFDCRTFCVPNKTEGVNAILWREQDAVRNSIQMLGQANFSHNQLYGKSCNKIQEMLFQQKAINWNNLDPRIKRGGYFQKVEVERAFTAQEIEKLPEKHEARRNPLFKVKRKEIRPLDLPQLNKVENKEEVFFDGQPFQTKSL